MKITKRVTAIALCIIMMTVSASIVFANYTPSSWAQEQVNAAIAENLVPQNLRYNFTQAITRAEFCDLAVALYETLRGEITGRATFADTNESNVEKMAYIGVVSGVGNDRFDPDGTLTREQAAVMLSRLADAIGRPLPEQAAAFADTDDIAPWAVEYVGRIQAAGIMSGVSDNRFAPQQPYTREQSIVTVMRMFASMQNGIADMGILAPPVSPVPDGEILTLEESRNDPDFGAFLPANVPSGFSFDHARRVTNQDTDSLFIFWHTGADSIHWQISKPTDHDRERIVSVDNREKFDVSLYPIPWAFSVPEELREFVMNPVFFAEDLTLDVIRARTLSDERRGGLQVSSFSVLYGDVIITISANGLSPEQVWEMLAELI